jgi:hypothetical protein
MMLEPFFQLAAKLPSAIYEFNDADAEIARNCYYRSWRSPDVCADAFQTTST